MNRIVLSGLWNLFKNPLQHLLKSSSLTSSPCTSLKYYSSLTNFSQYNYFQSSPSLKNLTAQPLNVSSQLIWKRDLTKFSLRKGKRKSVKCILKRFYRLDWGIWIRGKCGRQKKLYTKSANRKRRLRQHVFCNATQSYLLDKMVGNYWRKPKYYIDDPYEPYHRREEFYLTRKKPIIPDTI